MSDKETEEATVSLVEVLEEDEELEEEATAVLGGSDHERCSYPLGYVKRQALYACNTCTPAHVDPAGICLACSYKCHEGHDLFELYTKRNFCCDCGNGRFTDLECKLHSEKQQSNGANKYSHNFFGLYCTCKRPYPDPEDPVEDEMIQCIICEDWFHGRHLGCTVPDSVETQEMVCSTCMNQQSFLWKYTTHIKGCSAASSENGEREQKTEEEEEEEKKNGEREVKTEEEKKNGVEEVKREGERSEEEVKQEKEVKKEEEKRGVVVEQASTSLHNTEEATSDRDEVPSKRVRQELACRLKELKLIGGESSQSGAVFWPSGWRSKLCSCTSCQELYSTGGVSFLLDESDTVLAYENKGKSDDQSGHDPLMSALDNLNRVQQLEIIHGYNDMKTELKDFLQTFAAEGKVVTPEDIRQFFEQQQSRKRSRAANPGQFYCS